MNKENEVKHLLGTSILLKEFIFVNIYYQISINEAIKFKKPPYNKELFIYKITA
jgi:hypothetical protein